MRGYRALLSDEMHLMRLVLASNIMPRTTIDIDATTIVWASASAIAAYRGLYGIQ